MIFSIILLLGSVDPANGSSTLLVRNRKSDGELLTNYTVVQRIVNFLIPLYLLIYCVNLFVCILQDSIEKGESYNNRGKVEFQEGRYEKACQLFTSALKCLPKDQEKDKRVKYLCNRAMCYVKLVCCYFQKYKCYWKCVFFSLCLL